MDQLLQSMQPSSGMTGSISPVKLFNNILLTFMNELDQLLGDKEPAFANTFEGFRLLIESDDKDKQKRPLGMFMDKISPHLQMIHDRDETFFSTCLKDIPFLQDIHIEKYWADFSDEQKDAMWRYLDLLTGMGTILSFIPENVLESLLSDITSGRLDINQMMANPMMVLGYIQQNPAFGDCLKQISDQTKK